MDISSISFLLAAVLLPVIVSSQVTGDYPLNRHHVGLQVPRSSDRCGKIRAPGAFSSLELGLSEKPTEAVAGQFPWFAQIGYDNFGSLEFSCYGALISPNYVVTNMKCAYDPSKGVPVMVRLGLKLPSINSTVCHPRGGCSSTIQDIPVERIRLNEGFRLQWRHDISLIKLKEPAKLNEYVSPVCLPDDSEIRRELAGKSVFVTEWSEKEPTELLGNYLMKDSSEDSSAEEVRTVTAKKEINSKLTESGQLQYYSHTITNSSQCENKFRSAFDCPLCSFDTGNVLCMETEFVKGKGASSKCVRQVGLPITYIAESTDGIATAYLAGISIYSYRNCEINVPIVATKIADNMNFILENVDF